MDILVWFIEMDDETEERTIASAVTSLGVDALAALTFSKTPVYVIMIQKSPKEFIEGLPEGIVACLYIDGLLQELEPETKCLQ